MTDSVISISYSSMTKSDISFTKIRGEPSETKAGASERYDEDIVLSLKKFKVLLC